MASSLTFSGLDKLISNTQLLEVKFDAALHAYANTASKKVEAYAKQNRPWTDRTDNARNGLNARAEKYGRNYRIALAHGVYYGIYLELARGKKYAIIDPTIKAMSPEVFKGLQGLLDKARY